MQTIKQHKNHNHILYFSTLNETGETIYSFSPDFEDIWTQEDQDLHNQKSMESTITKRQTYQNDTTIMHQITRTEAINLAKTHCNYKTEFECCLVDWVKQHARTIAEIETKRRDKTNCGDFPKGWKAAMLHDSANQAEANVLAQFLAIHCMCFDGIIWLNNWEIINTLKK